MTDALVIGEGDRQRWSLLVIASAPIEDQSHRTRMGRSSLQGLLDRRLKLLGAESIKQQVELVDGYNKGMLASRKLAQELFSLRLLKSE